ncbi:hypothetical protein M3Y99_01130700 [Aphelenchoides fujianensis]|nr:hypothetical protein M3Y99_01130700 [Aphelenchoides fujianensis]
MSPRVDAEWAPTRRISFFALLLVVSCVCGLYVYSLGGSTAYLRMAVAVGRSPVWREAEGGCFLPDIDPWDPAMRRYLRPTVWPPCTPAYPQRSRLFFNGTLLVKGGEGEECFHRCHEMLDDRRVVLSKWVRGEQTPAGHWTAAPACDVLEVKCALADGNTTFKYMHSQIAHRPARPDQAGSKICKKGLKKRHFIGDDFAHYRSMMNEDASRTIFHHPNCRGFGRLPTDHYMRALMLQVDGRQTANNTPPDPAFRKLLLKKSCREKHHLVLHHLDQFLRRYPNEPKFSLNWITNLAHRSPRDLYHGDGDLLAFFQRHEQRLQNAFVFLMGDHGPSYGKLRNTPTGRLEANNPLFALVLPAHLRSNVDLQRQLKENGRRLISHYDVYATLLEIARVSEEGERNDHSVCVQYGNEWTNRTEFSTTSFKSENRRLLGASLLHPLLGARDCHSLGIPFQYCLCQAGHRPSNDTRTAVRIAKAAIKRMNKKLAAAGFDRLCARLKLDRKWPPEIYELGGGDFFKVVLRARPRGAIHEVFARLVDGRVKFLVDTFPQLTQYNQYAACIPRGIFLQNYCYCGEPNTYKWWPKRKKHPLQKSG